MINKYKNRLSYFVNFIDSYLEPGSKEILKDNISGLISIPVQKKTSGRWNFIIPIQYPLKFRPCEINGMKVQIDIACHIEGIIPCKINKKKSEGHYIDKYNILIRVWSLDDKLTFREGIDSDDLLQNLIDNKMKRVILRFHIDRRMPGTQIEEPLYHMHFGGISQPNEISWYPKNIDVPRFQYFPLDIILATEFILMNFFALQSYDLREDPEWKSIIYTAQELFLNPCVFQYYSFIGDCSETFLAHTINWNQHST